MFEHRIVLLKKRKPMKYDVIIIGSGIAGLTAGAILGRKGKKVLIVEKSSSVGGAIRRFKRNNIAFDVGFHGTGCLGSNDILANLWEYCGIFSKITTIPFPKHAKDLFQFEDYKSPINGFFSYEDLQQELISHFPQEQKGICTYFKTLREICLRIPFYNQDLPLTPYLHSIKPSDKSLANFLSSLTDNPFIKAVLCAPVYLYGTPVLQASLEKHAIVSHGYYTGTYTVDGGGQAVVDAFIESLSSLGVDIITSDSVETIITDSEKVTGVLTSSGREIATDNIIHTGHPVAITQMLDTHLMRPASRKRLLRLENSLSFFMVYGELENPINNSPLEWTNYYSIRAGFEILPASNIYPRNDRGLMLTSPGKRDNKDLQFNENGVILCRPAYWEEVKQYQNSRKNNRPKGYEEYKTCIGTEMLETAHKKWGHICGTITPLAVGTPLTFRDELTSPEGSAYGALHDKDQLTPSTQTSVPGLWLSGQSTLMTGILGASLAALVTVGKMLNLEEVWDDIRQC